MNKHVPIELLACLLALALLAGCGTTDANYKVLSFFFDGVPSPDEVAALEAKRTGKSKGKKVVKSFQHGPYEAKMCNACHEQGTNNLILPVEKLCFKCHKFVMDKKYIHGPLASGGCILCHDPHSSRYEFLLSAESKEFCFKCHDRKDVLRNPVHEGVEAECTDCHNPHMSDTEFLLR